MATLDEIIEAKRHDLEARKQKTPLEAMRALASMQERPPLLLNSVTPGKSPLLIGRIRYSPPSNDGEDGEDPVAEAVRCARIGLDAVSLFTDDTVYSGGQDDLMFVVRALQPQGLPVISEDFIIDEYQIVEARAAGAAAVMLDASLVDLPLMRALASLTERNRMTAIVRVGSASALEDASAISPQAVALSLSEPLAGATEAHRLRQRIPSHIRVVLDGGLTDINDVRAAARMGVHALLLDTPLLDPDIISDIRAQLMASAPE